MDVREKKQSIAKMDEEAQTSVRKKRETRICVRKKRRTLQRQEESDG